MIEFDMNRFLTKNDMGYYYSEKELNIFLSVLDSILRGNESEGEGIINGKVLRIRVEIEEEE
jgi:hypothetical protein